MVDSISNATNAREIGASQSRTQPSPTASAKPDPATQLTPDQRVDVLQSAVEKLIKKNLPTDSKLQIVQDKDAGTYIYQSVDPQTGKVISQWPPEAMIKLREQLREMEGVLVDKTV